MDGTKDKFPFPARVAPEQSWESRAGRWTLPAQWNSKFDVMATRKRGRPLIQWDGKLSNITRRYWSRTFGLLFLSKVGVHDST